MAEKRREKRSPIELAASYGIGNDPRPEREAKIYNVSSEGFCFTSDSKLKVDEKIQLAVDLDTTDEVIITVKVVWVKKNDDNKKYTIGVQIAEKEGPEFTRFMEFYNNSL
ncbi:MAG: PilZ domain-containing protein [Candidatus Omnitrophica bacterium]|nr:PilZ domain-containing protein [Candidatus Omnitrophota bacterium]